jgi:hypothetical protein
LSFAGREVELLRMSKILQDVRIRYQRRDAFWSNVSINDRVNQCRAKIAPPFVSRCSLGEPRDKLFLQRCSNSGKIHARTQRRTVARPKRCSESPK